MDLLLRIAWRNLMRHRTKSLVIGALLFLGALIMTVGNGVLAGMDRGLRTNMVDRFLGHLVVVSTNQEHDYVFFTPMGESVELLRGYTNIRRVLADLPFVERFLPVTRGAAMVLSEDGPGGFSILFGVKLDEYQAMFRTNVELLEGRPWTEGERGILLTADIRGRLHETTGHWYLPAGAPLARTNLTPAARSNAAYGTLLTRTNLVLMGFANDGSTLDVLVPVRGVHRYRVFNRLWSFINLVDLETFRECFNYTTAADAEVRLTAAQKKALEADEPDEILRLFEATGTAEPSAPQPAAADLRAKTRRAAKPDLDAGAYNFVLVKLRPGTDFRKAERDLQSALRAAAADGRVLGWRRAAGQIGEMATIVRGALFVFVLFVYFVAAIVIMNTLIMNAIERTPEIGMMRAIGATKGFIGRMFVAETFLLSFVFGGAGILLGSLTVRLLALLRITSTNEILQLLFGGDVFHPVLDLPTFAMGLLQLLFVTFASVLYPVAVARSITPLQAIARD